MTLSLQILTHVTVYVLILLSLDRYAAIVRPIRSRTTRTMKKATISCVAVWIGK